MKKKEFIDAVAAVYEGEYTRIEIKEIIDVIFNGIMDVVADGDEVNIIGFGKFTTAIRKAHKSRNPATGESVDVPDRKAVRFKAGKLFRDAVSDAYQTKRDAVRK